MEATDKIALYTALVAAQHAAEAVAKKAKNTFHGYNYASAEAVLGVANEALAEAGLAAFPVSVAPLAGYERHEYREEEYLEKGEKLKYNRITANRRIAIDLLVVHGASGQSEHFVSSVPVCPEKGKPEDKSEFAARTEGLAYALRDLLLLQRLAENDISGRDDTEEGKGEGRTFQVGKKGDAAERPKSQSGANGAERHASQSSSQVSTAASGQPSAASASKSPDTVIQGPKGQTELPGSVSVAAAPPPATGAPASAPASGVAAVSAAAAASPTALSSDRDDLLKTIRETVGKKLSWTGVQANALLRKLFGPEAKLDTLATAQLADLDIMLATMAKDGPEAFEARKASCIALHPSIYAPGAGQ